VKTYKFLATGAKGPITGFQWPLPQLEAAGAWVEAGGPLESCGRGAHLCRPNELAFWIHDELWEVETDGERIEGYDCIVVERARLLRRIDDWQHGGAAKFAHRCAERAVDFAARAPSERREAIAGYLEGAQWAAGESRAAEAAFCSALVAAKLEPPQLEAAFRRERAWQADYIARVVLGLV
jgi:hypothetical protein